MIRKLLSSYQVLDLHLLFELHLLECIFLIVVENGWFFGKLVISLVHLNLIVSQRILEDVWILDLVGHGCYQSLRCVAEIIN